MMGGSHLKIASWKRLWIGLYSFNQSKGGFSGIDDCLLKAAYVRHSNQIYCSLSNNLICEHFQ